MHGSRAGLVPLAVLQLTAAALVGCTPQPGPPRPTPSPSGSASEAWPRVPGAVLASSSPAGEQVVRVAVEDPEQAYVRARTLLVDAGFMLTKDRPGSGGGDGQACTPALCVSFDATDDPEYGPSLHYEAFHSSGVAPL